MKAILFIAAQGSERAANAVLLAVLAYAFGLGNEADTYFVVQIIPAVMVSMIGDSFFVTTLRAFANTLDESMRWRRFGSYALVYFAALGVGAALIALAAAPLISVLAPGKNAEWVDHAAQLQRLAALQLPLHGIGFMLASALIGTGRTSMGVLRLTLSNSAVALAAVIASALNYHSAASFILANLMGIAAIDIIMAVESVRAMGGHRPWPLEGAAMKEAWSGLCLISGANLAQNLILLMERAVASFLAPGSIASITMARMVAPLIGLLPTGLANARFAATVNLGHIRPHLGQVVAFSLAAAAPLVILLILRVDSVIALLYQRGNFSGMDTMRVAQLALLLCLSFPYQSLSTPLFKMMQGEGRDRSALGAALFGAALYLPLALWWGGSAEGLVGAYSLAMNAQIALMIFLLMRNGDRNQIKAPYGRLGLAACVTALAGWALPFTSNAAMIQLVETTAMITATYMAALAALGIRPRHFR